MQQLQIGGRWVGEDEPCLVIAETGANHHRDLNREGQFQNVVVMSLLRREWERLAPRLTAELTSRR